MLIITDKQLDRLVKSIMDKVDFRISHIEDALKGLRDEVRRVNSSRPLYDFEEHVHFNKIIERLSNIEEQLTNVFLIKRRKRKEEEESDEST